MKTKITKLSVLALAALSAAAFAADAITLTRKPKEGETTKYRMKAELELGGMPITFNGLLSEKVLKVEPNGAYSLETAQIEGKVSINGQEQDVPGTGSSTINYKGNGDVVEIKGDQVTPEAYRMANLGVVADPGKPINVGDTWSHEIKADKKTGALGVKADYKFLGEEKVGDVDTLKIKVNVKETEGSDPASADGTVWLNKADGMLIKMNSKWVNAPYPGAGMPVTATITLVREK